MPSASTRLWWYCRKIQCQYPHIIFSCKSPCQKHRYTPLYCHVIIITHAYTHTHTNTHRQTDRQTERHCNHFNHHHHRYNNKPSPELYQSAGSHGHPVIPQAREERAVASTKYSSHIRTPKSSGLGFFSIVDPFEAELSRAIVPKGMVALSPALKCVRTLSLGGPMVMICMSMWMWMCS